MHGAIQLDTKRGFPTDSAPLTWEECQDRYPKLLRTALVALIKTDEPNTIVIRTETALSVPAPSKYRKLKPDEEFKSFEDRETEDTMSVAVAQPHRRGSLDPWAGEPLFIFVTVHGLSFGLYKAGEEYDKVLRRAKVARGFAVPGNIPPADVITLTPAQIEAMREAAILREIEFSGILRAIMPRLPRVLERLCFDKLTPSPYDTGIIKHGLLALAAKYRFLDRGINDEKPI